MPAPIQSNDDVPAPRAAWNGGSSGAQFSTKQFVDNFSILSIGGSSVSNGPIDDDDEPGEETRRATRHFLAMNSSLHINKKLPPQALFKSFVSESSGRATVLTSQPSMAAMDEDKDEDYERRGAPSPIEHNARASRGLDDEAIYRKARKALKHAEALSKRQAMVGKWKVCKKVLSSSSVDARVGDIQVVECKTEEDYSIIAKVNLPCSLQEVMNVFSSDDAQTFHASMVGVFGDMYVYGSNFHQINYERCATFRGRSSSTGRNSADGRPRMSNASVAQVFVKTASFLSKKRPNHRRTMTFLDYVEEKSEKKSATRVMQTLGDENVSNEAGETRVLTGVLAGYVMQEDPDEQYTRVFFHATHTKRANQRKIDAMAVERLREMAKMVCKLQSIILRRRLGAFSVMSRDDVALLQSACCYSCHTAFSVVRRKHFCHLCGQFTCSKCSNHQKVEKRVGHVEKFRICHECVAGASYFAFHGEEAARLAQQGVQWRHAKPLIKNEDVTSYESDSSSDDFVLMSLHSTDDFENDLDLAILE
ncbi:TPA: hypothetical protein N0F65_001701 [Lagenidium giganteum]|uniref:FYVE-type domain-containing protein n=1 Tax=Lagenidium giganteum TaxID=4803 RepID=A0AAV2YR20_9STRA|nr:TPA: hypothetical protein N0F65_001701 [Lagenidium giganteum]